MPSRHDYALWGEKDREEAREIQVYVEEYLGTAKPLNEMEGVEKVDLEYLVEEEIGGDSRANMGGMVVREQGRIEGLLETLTEGPSGNVYLHGEEGAAVLLMPQRPVYIDL